VIARFGRNQHQTLVRRLFHIQQTTTVADYVYRFAQLVDQIAAYETRPDPVHYTTRFLDGLKPAVRVLVAIQQPPDLDTTYSLALLYEELGDGSTPLNTALPATPHNRRFQQPFPVAQPPPPPQPPGKWVSHSVEERRATEQQRGQGDDRWSSLKAYMRSKGLCFVCGERWARDHQCKASIQLHVVQEMIECMHQADLSDDSVPDEEPAV
jgi:hypothetical protein